MSLKGNSAGIDGWMSIKCSLRGTAYVTMTIRFRADCTGDRRRLCSGWMNSIRRERVGYPWEVHTSSWAYKRMLTQAMSNAPIWACHVFVSEMHEGESCFDKWIVHHISYVPVDNSD
jgi:hypothetical protein